MKVVLVVLSGDPQSAHDKVASKYPEAAIETVSRSELETGNSISRLRSLRARHPDVVAIGTERLAWQRGQKFFMLFGALAGAKEILIIDAYGGRVAESSSHILTAAPARLAQEVFGSLSVFARARRELRRFEKAAAKSGSQDVSRNAITEDGTARHLVFLRATPGPGTQAGGAASHIKGVVDALSEIGVQVSLVSNDEIAGLDSKTSLTIFEHQSGAGATRALFDIHNNEMFSRSAVALIASSPPDLIYQRYARFGWAGVAAKLKTGRPLFLEYNGSEVWVGRHWDHVGMLDLLARYERLNLAAADRVFVVSDVERRNLERAGVAPAKIIVNPNGVDTEKFRPDIGGSLVRQELGIDAQDVLVGFVGSFGPWHGVLTLADTIKSIPRESRVRFLLVGSGSLHAEVEQRLSVECEERRVILTGAVEHERVPALLDACDILVSPHVPLAGGADFFGSPTKLFEYMALGKGIVASRLGQIGEVLTHEETALLVEPGNVADLSQAIMRLAGSSELRLSLGRKAREAVVLKYTWKHNAQRIVDAYNVWLHGTQT